MATMSVILFIKMYCTSLLLALYSISIDKPEAPNLECFLTFNNFDQALMESGQCSKIWHFKVHAYKAFYLWISSLNED
jgi:hypothetical protein